MQRSYSIATILLVSACIRLVDGFLAPIQHTTSTIALAATKDKSTRVRFLNRIGFRRTSKDNYELHLVEQELANQRKIAKQAGRIRYNVTDLDDLDAYWRDEQGRFRNEKGEINYDVLLRSLNVQGDTQMIGDPDLPEFTHAVAQILHDRRRRGSMPTTSHTRDDGFRVALAIEGGGMRGCISAGAVCALHHLNLTDAVDVVYGSSAGTIVGAYFITGQLPWFGPEVYYDCLTTAGREFIDTRRLLRALGFGLLDPRLLRDVLTRPEHGKPVLNLPYLLCKTVQEKRPLDWDKFVEKQKVQPLKIMASGCKSEKALVFDYANGAFRTLSELADCMHASCLLPGIAGPLMNFDKRALEGQEVDQKFVLGNNAKGDHYEPMADALLFEPLPYRTAVKEGCTHVLTVRSRPDGTDVTGKGGVFERLIFRRFFLRKNRLPNMFKRLKMQLHKKLYAEEVIELNEAAKSRRDYTDTSAPHLMTIALPPGSEEVTRLETGREAIFEGIRRGFARAYDCLVEDPAERGRGAVVAKEYFPDEILDYDPNDYAKTNESAFSLYLQENNVKPKVWADREPTKEAAPAQ